MFSGSMVALVTPMQADGSLALEHLSQLIDWHIQAGTTAIVVAGTTGESATLTDKERQILLEHAVKQAAGRIPIIAGTGTQSTQTSIELSQQAIQAGADACLLVTPYYNKPTQEGLYQHYLHIAKAVPAPLILYNVPGRTACDLLPETAARLSTLANIVGIKEALADMGRIKKLRELCGDSLAVYSSDDATALECIRLGGKGVISVTANIAPSVMHRMCQAALQGNFNAAEAINAKLMLLHERLFVESNPIPTKWLLHTMGLIPEGIRLPLTPLAGRYHLSLQEALQAARLSESEEA